MKGFQQYLLVLLPILLCFFCNIKGVAAYQTYEIEPSFDFNYKTKFTAEEKKILDELHRRHNAVYFNLGRIIDLTESLPWLPKKSIVFEKTLRFINVNTPLDELVRLKGYVNSDKLNFYILAKRSEKKKANLKDPKQLEKFKKMWENTDFRYDDEVHFFNKFHKKLEFINQKNKIERNLLASNIDRASFLVSRYKGASASLQRFRLKVARNPHNFESTIAKPSKYDNDEIVNFFYTKYLLKNNKNNEAFKRLLRIEPTMYPDRWWKVYHTASREAMSQKKYKIALDLASKVDMTGSINYEEQQWLKGWIKLRFLNLPYEAIRDFQEAYNKALYSMSKSRAIYWLQRAHKQVGNVEAVEKWEEVAKKYVSRFYGQLLCNSRDVRVYKLDNKLIDYDNNGAIEPADQKFLDGFKYYMNKGDYRGSYRFLNEAREFFTDKYSTDSIVAYYLKDNILFPGVLLNKYYTNRGGRMKDYGYPLLEFNSSEKFKIVYHALIRQESEFNYIAKSPVGAYGLMQLMPGTARYIAKKIKMDSSSYAVYPRSNLKSGIYYFDEMMGNYNSLVLSICAYNAGPGNVNKWLKRYGDFRKFKTLEEKMDWIEKIPFRETRMYVKKVLENTFVYSKIIGYSIDNIGMLMY